MSVVDNIRCLDAFVGSFVGSFVRCWLSVIIVVLSFEF